MGRAAALHRRATSLTNLREGMAGSARGKARQNNAAPGSPLLSYDAAPRGGGQQRTLSRSSSSSTSSMAGTRRHVTAHTSRGTRATRRLTSNASALVLPTHGARGRTVKSRGSTRAGAGGRSRGLTKRASAGALPTASFLHNRQLGQWMSTSPGFTTTGRGLHVQHLQYAEEPALSPSAAASARHVQQTVGLAPYDSGAEVDTPQSAIVSVHAIEDDSIMLQ